MIRLMETSYQHIFDVLLHVVNSLNSTMKMDVELLKGYLQRKSETGASVDFDESLSGRGASRTLEHMFDNFDNRIFGFELMAQVIKKLRMAFEADLDLVTVALNEFLDEYWSSYRLKDHFHNIILYLDPESNVDFVNIDKRQIEILLDYFAENSLYGGYTSIEGSEIEKKIIFIRTGRDITKKVVYMDLINNGYPFTRQQGFSRSPRGSYATFFTQMGEELIKMIAERHNGGFEKVFKGIIDVEGEGRTGKVSLSLDPGLCYRVYFPININEHV